MIKRRTFIQGSAALLASTSLLRTSWSQAAPGGRLLYGYPPGAVGDQLANGVLPLLQAQDGPHYSLHTVEGRNTRLASLQAKASPANGTTLLQVLSSSFTLQPHIYKKLDFDPLTDFEPIAMLGEVTYALTLGPVVPASVNSVKSFFAWLQINPEYRNIGVSIYGTLGHLALRILARNNDIDDVPLRGQPYKGTAAMLNDLHQKGLAAAFTVASNFGDKDAHKDLRPIAITSRERLKYWPGVPTLYEQGFTDVDITGWFGWFAPKGTPAAVTGALRERLKGLQASAQYSALQAQLLMVDTSTDPLQIDARIREESARYAKLLGTYALGKID
jgi:tripartite-type tricarboxylate transporter receptor subunit TctC